MSALRARRALPYVVGVLAAVALLFGFVAGFEAADRASARKGARGVRAANAACAPSPPSGVRFDDDGPGGYWRVTCPDRSVRIVRWDGR